MIANIYVSGIVLSTLYNRVIDTDSSQTLYEMGIFMSPHSNFPNEETGMPSNDLSCSRSLAGR